MSKVKYRVLAPSFVDGHYIDPRGRGEVFVEAAPGLEGPSLALVDPEQEAADKAAVAVAAVTDAEMKREIAVAAAKEAAAKAAEKAAGEKRPK